MLREILVTEEILSQREFMDKLTESKVKVGVIKTGQQLSIFGSSLEVIASQNRENKAQLPCTEAIKSNLSSYRKYRRSS